MYSINPSTSGEKLIGFQIAGIDAGLDMHNATVAIQYAAVPSCKSSKCNMSLAAGGAHLPKIDLRTKQGFPHKWRELPAPPLRRLRVCQGAQPRGGRLGREMKWTGGIAVPSKMQRESRRRVARRGAPSLSTAREQAGIGAHPRRPRRSSVTEGASDAEVGRTGGTSQAPSISVALTSFQKHPCAGFATTRDQGQSRGDKRHEVASHESHSHLPIATKTTHQVENVQWLGRYGQRRRRW
ncbi:hypothetical protein C8J57DRAFT_1223554 [Mycena rebaudengoi]|nr:hypothetical protein C8J57DRAFT_1223554 [Mycena rebaudengoi]